MNLPFKRRMALLAVLLSVTSVAQAGVVVVMSSKSDVSSLSKAQVAQIFMAKTDACPTDGWPSRSTKRKARPCATSSTTRWPTSPPRR